MSTTEKQQKLAFTSDNEELMKVVAKQLKEKGNIKSIMICKEYAFYLYVNSSDYQKAITTSFDMSEDEKSKIKWVDENHYGHTLDYYPMMYGLLPIVERGNTKNHFFDYNYKDPIVMIDKNIDYYLNPLKEYCGTEDIIVEVDRFNNAYTILAKPTNNISHELLMNRCVGFNYVHGKTPFIKIYYPTRENPFTINIKQLKEQRIRDLSTYFDESLFKDIIECPEGFNIAPHNDCYPKYMRQYGPNNFYLIITEKKLLPDNTMLIKGRFTTSDIKGNKEEKENYCVVTDRGEFSSTLIPSQNGMTMTTEVNVSRAIQGKDLDGQNLRDAFFTCLSGDNTQGTITCTEHFVTIANGTRLLHYSEDHEFFEIYDLPDDFMIEKGLRMETLPKVFDDIHFDLNDKDLEEVYAILNSRKQNSNTRKRSV